MNSGITLDEIAEGPSHLAKSGFLCASMNNASIDALFIEAHKNPNFAKCDGPSAIPSNLIPEFIDQVCEIDNLVKNQDKIQIG